MVKKAKTKQSKKAAEKVLRAGPLRQPSLAGMPRIRNTKLDKLAEAIGECRETINDRSREIKGYRAAALKEMLAKALNFWSHGGVDFIMTPGEPELKIKTHKAGSSETGAGDADEADGEVYAEAALHGAEAEG